MQLAKTPRFPTRQTMTMMEPNGKYGNSPFSSALGISTGGVLDDGFEANQQPDAQTSPVPRPDETNLYEMPTELHPTYRPLPMIIKLSIAFLSTAISALTTWALSSAIWLRPLTSIRDGEWKKVLMFLSKALACYVLTNCALQDLLLPPSRVSTQALMNRYFLPSRLSRYEKLPLRLNEFTEEIQERGVHFLEYRPRKSRDLSTIYVNHGFGASSLSWLPALPKLVERLGASVGLGHDAPGFGFTDRSESVGDFTTEASARTGSAVLQNVTSSLGERSSVVLFGHSMGCITTLRMALELDDSVQQRIVLVAPALGLISRKRYEHNQNSNENPFRKRILSPLTNVLLEAPAAYLLRRAVGAKSFWKKGLQAVWGDPAKVTQSDVLRFQWHSIGEGWERGLLKFSAAQTLPTRRTDRDLLALVLQKPGVHSLHVIVGSRDRVVSPRQVRRFFEPFGNVSISVMDGLGHDPFEESADEFVELVESLFNS